MEEAHVTMLCALSAAQGSARDREKRERERQQLADLGKWGAGCPQPAACCPP